MEPWWRAHVWLWALLACAGAAGRRGPGDSVLDIIDTQQVERMLAARHRPPPPAAPTPEPDDLPPGIDFRKLLKSSKDARFITKKEYLKQDWCKTEPLVQTLHEPGCLPATIINKFCYGQCNSFYIPKSPRRRGDAPPSAFRSCSFCRPSKWGWTSVTLRCPRQSPPYRRKRLQRVKQCRCQAVAVN